jgi:hypothetical protein
MMKAIADDGYDIGDEPEYKTEESDDAASRFPAWRVDC